MKISKTFEFNKNDPSTGFFVNMCDELVNFSEFDPALEDAIKWIDEQAKKKGISFYDMVFELLYKHDINSKAKNWIQNKN